MEKRVEELLVGVEPPRGCRGSVTEGLRGRDTEAPSSTKTRRREAKHDTKEQSCEERLVAVDLSGAPLQHGRVGCRLWSFVPRRVSRGL